MPRQTERPTAPRPPTAPRSMAHGRFPPAKAPNRTIAVAGRPPSRWPPTQRDISVSEFFAKNRHLLGFDNPRKALLTTVKEAVDNSLDACEEAGILPEIWVHIEATGTEPLQSRRAGQRPGHRQEADPADLRQAALRLEVSPPAAEPRPAGHRHQRRRHVRRADDRQAGEDHLARSSPSKPAHYYEIQIDTKKNKPRDSQRPRRRRRYPARRARAPSTSPKHGIEWVEDSATHGTRVTIELEGQVQSRPRQRRRVSRADGDRQSARHAALSSTPKAEHARLRALDRPAAAGAEGDQAASVRRRAGPAAGDAQGRRRRRRSRSF